MCSKRNIRLLLAISLLQGMVFYASVATLYRQAVGVGIFEITLIESASLLLGLLLEVPWGIAAERIGYRRTMIVCCCLFFVSKLVFWRADRFGGFLAERLLLSVVCSGLSGVDASFLYLSCDADDAQRVFGLYSALGTAGMLFSSLVFAVFIGSRYRFAALLTAITYGAAAALSFFLREVRPPQREHGGAMAAFRLTLSAFAHTRGLLTLVLAFSLLGGVHQCVSVFFSQLQYVRCGMDDRMIGVAGILATLAALCSARSDAFTRRLGARRFGLLLIAANALSCLLLAFTRSAALSVAAILTLCAANGLFDPLAQAAQNRLITQDDRATALSVNALVSDSVCIALNLILGRAAQAQLSLAFALCAGLCLSAAALYRAASHA